MLDLDQSVFLGIGQVLAMVDMTFEARDVRIPPIGRAGTLRIPPSPRGIVALNRMALARLNAEKSPVIVPGATHLFPERGALEAVIEHATHWFDDYLPVWGQRCA